LSYFVVDVEADGPYPGDYSMVCFGAIKVDNELDKTFYGQTAPISSKYDEKALSVSGYARQQHLHFTNADITMNKFVEWVEKTNKSGRAIFVSDNVAYDWQWINYYLHKYVGHNPFGFSGRRIGDLYCGLVKDTYARWKHLRKTKHTHNPVDDAKGNAEVILHMKNNMGLKIKLE